MKLILIKTTIQTTIKTYHSIQRRGMTTEIATITKIKVYHNNQTMINKAVILKESMRITIHYKIKNNTKLLHNSRLKN